MRIFYSYTLNSVARVRKSNYLPEQTEKVKEFEPGYRDQVPAVPLIDGYPGASLCALHSERMGNGIITVVVISFSCQPSTK